MRVIEEQMIKAIATKAAWSKDNTEVMYYTGDNSSHIRLHGHHIAFYDHNTGTITANASTLASWPTRTTKSRLRALDVDVYTKAHVTYLNGVAL